MDKTRYFSILILLILFSCTPSRNVDKSALMEDKGLVTTSAARVDSSKFLTIEDVFSGAYRMRHFRGVQWLEQGDAFTRLERSGQGLAIFQYNARTGEKSELVSVSQLTPGDSSRPLFPQSYQWSNDQSKLLIFTNTRRVWRQNTRGDYWVLDIPSNALKKVGGRFPESSLMFAKFSPDDRHIAYVSGHNLYVEDLSTGEIEAMTNDGSEDLINGTFDWAYEEEFFCKDGFRWSPDGKHIAFWRVDASDIGDYLMFNTTDSIYPYIIPVEYPKAGHNPSAAQIGIYAMDAARITWLDIPGDPRQHYLPRMQWTGPTEVLVQQVSRKQNTLTFWKCDVNANTCEAVYSERDDAWVDIVHMDVNAPWEMQDLDQIGEDVFRLTDKNGWRHLYAIPLDGKPARQIIDDPFDIARMYLLDPGSKKAYFCASPSNATQRYLFEMSLDGQSRPRRLTPRQYSGINQYHIAPNGKFAIHQHSSSTTPHSYHLISLPDHKIIKTLAENSTYHKLLKENVALPQVEFFEVITDDGITMDGRMYKPHDFDAQKKYPVIFYVYGEPAGQTATDNWSSNLWPVLLTQMGYLYITMDNRGQPSIKGREWRKSIYRKIGVLNARDQAMAAKKVMDWPFTDPDRVAVWGWSGGGAMTLNLLFRYPEMYQTGIAVAAVTNHLYYDNIYTERYMGLPAENMDDYVEGSPVTYAKDLQGNLLYIHGTGDDNVHYQNAEALINTLVKLNKQFDMMSYPNRSHGIYEGENTTRHLYTLMTQYLQTHCPPGARER